MTLLTTHEFELAAYDTESLYAHPEEPKSEEALEIIEKARERKKLREQKAAEAKKAAAAKKAAEEKKDGEEKKAPPAEDKE